MLTGAFGRRFGLLLSVSVCLSAWPAAVNAELNEYEDCVESCRGKFEPVVEAEKSCEETLGYVHGELKAILVLLSGPSACKGRNRGACKDFLDYAHPALEKLIANTLDTSDCLKLDAKAIQDELWLFDTIKACKGDGTFTDLHDFFGAKRKLVVELEQAGLHYSYVKQAFDPYDDFHGHKPECEMGMRPALSHFWPLFQFHRALDSLMAFQACMPSCRPPTEREKRLWALREKVSQLQALLAPLSVQLATATQERDKNLVSEYGYAFPCRAFARSTKEFAEHRETLERFDRTLESLLADPERDAQRLDELEKEASLVGGALREDLVDKLTQQCRDEDARAVKLMVRKRAVVDTILRGDMFCIDAAKAFVNRGERDSVCEWIGECNIPLTCDDGKCCGEVSVADVRGVLSEAKALADTGLQLKLHDERGLVQGADKEVKKLETGLAQARKELATLGWDEAVAGWRATYKKALPARLEDLEVEIKALIEEHEPAEGEKQPRECRRALGDLQESIEALEGLREALGDADPADRAKWVRLKGRDADEIRIEMGEAQEKLAICGQQEEEGLPSWILWAAAGLLALIAGAALLVFLRRR
jgi:hypothetical protein